MVLVVTLSARTVEGAAQAGAAFSLFNAVILRGAGLAWITRGHLPGFFPLSPKWRFVLFGLASIQFARHPEGLVEHGKRRATVGVEARLAARRERASLQDADGGEQP